MNNFPLHVVALLALICVQSAAVAEPLRDHPGLWMGDLKLPDGVILRIGADIYTRADGKPWASVASPDQGAYDIPVKSIRPEGGNAVVLDIGNATLKLAWVTCTTSPQHEPVRSLTSAEGRGLPESSLSRIVQPSDRATALGIAAAHGRDRERSN